MKREYKTTSNVLDVDASDDHFTPIAPEGEGWRMCGSTSTPCSTSVYSNSEGRDDIFSHPAVRINWFWERELPEEEPVNGGKTPLYTIRSSHTWGGVGMHYRSLNLEKIKVKFEEMRVELKATEEPVGNPDQSGRFEFPPGSVIRAFRMPFDRNKLTGGEVYCILREYIDS